MINNYVNIEDRHLGLLLLMYRTLQYYRSIEEVLEVKNSLEDFFYNLPDEVLKSCGYSKNISSYGRITTAINYLSKENIFKLAMETEAKDLPTQKGLEFLKLDYKYV